MRPRPNVAWLDPLAVFALALVVRLSHAAFLARTPWFRGPIIDAHTYDRIAIDLANGRTLGAFYQPPLYPYALSCLYRAGIEIGWGVAIVQSILGAATCALLVLIGRRAMEGDDVRRRRVGLATGCAAALCGPLVLYDLELLPPAIVDLCLVSALALAMYGGPRASWRDAAAGVLIGTAATGWALSILLLPCAAFARAVERREAVVLALVLGAAAPLAITAYHNAANGAPGEVVAWNGGLNLWLGNNPRWRETWRARPGAAFEPEVERPQRAGAVTPVEQDRWFQEQVVNDAVARPGDAVLRTLEKLYYAWHGREIRRNQDFEILRGASPVLRTLQWDWAIKFPFGLIAPLALLGAWQRRRERTARAWFLGAAAYSVAMASFFVATRYRLPMLLLLLPLAGDAGVGLFSGRWPKRELAALAVLVIFLNLPCAFTAGFTASPRERMLLEAQAWRAQGERDRAVRIARALDARWPRDPDVNMLEAELFIERGDCASAIPHLTRVVSGAPLASTPLLDLGRCEATTGHLDDAARAFERVLARDPRNERAVRGAAIVYTEQGQRGRALAMLARLRE